MQDYQFCFAHYWEVIDDQLMALATNQFNNNLCLVFPNSLSMSITYNMFIIDEYIPFSLNSNSIILKSSCSCLLVQKIIVNDTLTVTKKYDSFATIDGDILRIYDKSEHELVIKVQRNIKDIKNMLLLLRNLQINFLFYDRSSFPTTVNDYLKNNKPLPCLSPFIDELCNDWNSITRGMFIFCLQDYLKLYPTLQPYDDVDCSIIVENIDTVCNYIIPKDTTYNLYFTPGLYYEVYVSNYNKSLEIFDNDLELSTNIIGYDGHYIYSLESLPELDYQLAFNVMVIVDNKTFFAITDDDDELYTNIQQSQDFNFFPVINDYLLIWLKSINDNKSINGIQSIDTDVDWDKYPDISYGTCRDKNIEICRHLQRQFQCCKATYNPS